MKVGAIWYPKSFVAKARAIFKHHGGVVAGMFLCHNRVPAPTALRLLGL